MNFEMRKALISQFTYVFFFLSQTADAVVVAGREKNMSKYDIYDLKWYAYLFHVLWAVY